MGGATPFGQKSDNDTMKCYLSVFVGTLDTLSSDTVPTLMMLPFDNCLYSFRRLFEDTKHFRYNNIGRDVRFV